MVILLLLLICDDSLTFVVYSVIDPGSFLVVFLVLLFLLCFILVVEISCFEV
jgi:hypothetical protein